MRRSRPSISSIHSWTAIISKILIASPRNFQIDKFLLHWKASSQISLHVGGIKTLERLQWKKEASPIYFRLMDHFMKTRLSHKQKAFRRILRTVLAKITRMIFLHLVKVFSGISVTPSTIIICCHESLLRQYVLHSSETFHDSKSSAVLCQSWRGRPLSACQCRTLLTRHKKESRYHRL